MLLYIFTNWPPTQWSPSLSYISAQIKKKKSQDIVLGTKLEQHLLNYCFAWEGKKQRMEKFVIPKESYFKSVALIGVSIVMCICHLDQLEL